MRDKKLKEAINEIINRNVPKARFPLVIATTRGLARITYRDIKKFRREKLMSSIKEKVKKLTDEILDLFKCLMTPVPLLDECKNPSKTKKKVVKKTSKKKVTKKTKK